MVGPRFATVYVWSINRLWGAVDEYDLSTALVHKPPMKIPPEQQHIIRIALIFVLAGIIYIIYLRPTPVSLDTIIPNTPQSGATTIRFDLSNDTLLIPTQCLWASWDMNNTHGVYINGQGVAAPDNRWLCHVPPANGVIAQLRVILPDDTAIQYDFKVRVLIYDPIFLGLCLIWVTVVMMSIWEMKTLTALWWVIGMMSALCIFIIVLMAIITIGLFLQTPPTVWDDALMFARYAHNLSTTGIWTWNMGEAPVFGMTELAYGWMVYVVWRINGWLSPVQLVQYTSTLFGVLWIIIVAIGLSGISIALWRKQKQVSRFLLLMALITISLSAHTNLLHHFTSGMGTTTVLVYVTLYIIGMMIYIHQSIRSLMVFMGIFGGLGFVVRPDVMLFTVCVSIALWLFATKTYTRRQAVLFGSITAITFITTLIIARLYFGVALPLPFFAKSGGIDDGYLANQYVAVAIDQLGTYLYSNRYLILLIMAGGVIHPKAFIKRMSALERGLIAGMFGYIGYYALFVTQIMPEYQRFYYPTLPILIWLAYLGGLSMIDRLRMLIPIVWRFLHVPIRQAVVVAIIGVVMVIVSDSIHQTHLFIYDHQNTYYPPHDARWYQLAQFADIDNITVATTEVGAVAVANFSWRVIDLAGLNDTNFALNGFSASVLLNDYRPDLLYLPYPDYIEMIEAITTHPIFMRDYTYFTAGQVRLPMGIAIRNDSLYYADLLTIARP